jgi:hypothetical protein
MVALVAAGKEVLALYLLLLVDRLLRHLQRLGLFHLAVVAVVLGLLLMEGRMEAVEAVGLLAGLEGMEIHQAHLQRKVQMEGLEQ